MQKYVPTIGVDYGVKPVRLGEYDVGGACVCKGGVSALLSCVYALVWCAMVW